MAPSKAKDPGTFGKQKWRKFTSELEMLCSLSSPHTLDERLQSALLRILMLLQNVLSLGSKEEMTGSRFGKTPT
ncbi:hypothetical protein TNCV_3796081 [Trichonephila clavipes]|nr:hypothetical protein TNCV_3796081 [Trichonephila clavipes]